MIIAGGLKQVANKINFREIGLTKHLDENYRNYYGYFYGACAALLAAGLIHDGIFNGKSYLMVFILNVITIVVQSLTATIKHTTDNTLENIQLFLFLFWNGFSTSFTNFFITILIPLNIATKNRKSLELAGAGTTIAVINLFYWMFGLFASTFIEAIKLHFFKDVEREGSEVDIYALIVVLILSILSSAFIYKQARREFKELKAIFRA
jgi:hypothetical protein